MNKTGILMKSILASLLLWACQGTSPDSVMLDGPWKFKTGDDPAYAAVTCDDSSWGTLDPAMIWEKQGYQKYNGYAWYRKKVVIRSSLKKQYRANDSLQIFVGRVDDCDQVFLNGQLIGENGSTMVAGTPATGDFAAKEGIWNLQRRYVLSANDPRILWDRENLVAVRCFDHGGAGGITGGKMELSVIGLKDRVELDFSSTAFEWPDDSTVSKTFSLVNLTATERYKGELALEAVDCRSGIRIYGEKAIVELAPGQNLGRAIRFKVSRSAATMLRVRFTNGETRETISRVVEVPSILTPPVPATPRINGATVFGVRPWSPFLYQVAATGETPLTYRAADLPEGLTINQETGLITGSLKKRGEYITKLTVENPLGYAERELKIVVGDLISLTPPLGWNSWNCWGLSITDRKVRQAAEAMKSSGLAAHGWTYVNIDDGWEDTHDRNGNILPNAKFPNMTSLCSYVHSLGLKVGIYSSPGPKTCGGYEGSYGFEARDAMNYAAWGIDYLKYDWCSYGSIAPNPTLEQMKKPYRDMKHALRKTNRDIHYSLCQYGMGDVWTWGHEVDGNSWRTTGDIEDTWESMSSIGFSQGKCSPYAAPGRWNDPDMLVVGWVGWGPRLHYTRLTPEEQYTHITLWSLLASPLLIGCDLTRLDPFTLNLLTNDEVLAVNQDPMGSQAVPVRVTDTYEVWSRVLENGDMAVGLFNKTTGPLYVPVDMADLGAGGKWRMRDLWRQTDLGLVRGHFEMLARSHGVRFIRLAAKTN